MLKRVTATNLDDIHIAELGYHSNDSIMALLKYDDNEIK